MGLSEEQLNVATNTYLYDVACKLAIYMIYTHKVWQKNNI